MRRVWIAIALSSGCGDPERPLDPDVVADISRTPGDAEGIAVSGTYDLRFTLEECCEVDAALEEQTLCAFAGGPSTTVPTTVEVEVVQADGYLLFESTGFERLATGSINEDGSFLLGAVTEFSNLIIEASEVLRIEGTIDIVDGQHFAEGDLAHHLKGSSVIGEGPALSVQVDCVETFTFEGFKRLTPN